jgi:GT2 family glycosyltransferase
MNGGFGMNSGKISVVVLMHNNVSMTKHCLDALSVAIESLDHEIILLDNASTVDIDPLLKFSRIFKHFQYFRCEENVPFSIANNLGVSKSFGRWLLFLNNDVFLKPDSVKQLIESLESNEHVGVVGGKLLFPGEKYVQHAGIGQMLWEHPSNYGVGASPRDDRIQHSCERFALSGAMLCVSRKVFEKVSGFDERYIWGTEDIDFCLKIRAAGLQVLYCPEAVGIHFESATLKVTQNGDLKGNCRLYRQIWDHLLLPSEEQYVSRLKAQGIRTVAVFGMGNAARGLARILDENGIDICAFTASPGRENGQEYLGRPMIPIQQLAEKKYDRLMVASQYFFEVENMIRDYDPLHEPIYPLLN